MTLQDYLDNEIKRGVEEGIKRALEERVEQRFAQGIEQGVAQGIEQGKAEAVDTTVAILRELNISEEQILEQLMQKYSLTEEKAKSYLN